jgi:hypothetical protein
MNYFSTFPKILSTDYNDNKIILINLMKRAVITETLAKNPLIYYSYNIKDGETPDLISTKYYGDPSRYWLIMFANEMLDPQWDWPLNQNLWPKYIVEKYKNDAANSYNISANTILPYQVLNYTQSKVNQYFKVISTTDNLSSNTTTINVSINSDTYNSLSTGVTTQTFQAGYSVTQSITKSQQTIYEYEENLNESKRNIFLINEIYASEIEVQLQKLMKT